MKQCVCIILISLYIVSIRNVIWFTAVVNRTNATAMGGWKSGGVGPGRVGEE